MTEELELVDLQLRKENYSYWLLRHVRNASPDTGDSDVDVSVASTSTSATNCQASASATTSDSVAVVATTKLKGLQLCPAARCVRSWH